MGGNPEKVRAREDQLKPVFALIDSHGGDRRAEFSDLVRQIAQSRQPSLNERFEQLAKAMELPGWKRDIKAFHRFNASRNKLLHEGSSSIELSFGGEKEFQEERQYLEDLAERYVCRVLFGDAAVYPSRWRPKAIRSEEPAEA